MESSRINRQMHYFFLLIVASSIFSCQNNENRIATQNKIKNEHPLVIGCQSTNDSLVLVLSKNIFDYLCGLYPLVDENCFKTELFTNTKAIRLISLLERESDQILTIYNIDNCYYLIRKNLKGDDFNSNSYWVENRRIIKYEVEKKQLIEFDIDKKIDSISLIASSYKSNDKSEKLYGLEIFDSGIYNNYTFYDSLPGAIYQILSNIELEYTFD